MEGQDPPDFRQQDPRHLHQANRGMPRLRTGSAAHSPAARTYEDIFAWDAAAAPPAQDYSYGIQAHATQQAGASFPLPPSALEHSFPPLPAPRREPAQQSQQNPAPLNPTSQHQQQHQHQQTYPHPTAPHHQQDQPRTQPPQQHQLLSRQQQQQQHQSQPQLIHQHPAPVQSQFSSQYQAPLSQSFYHQDNFSSQQRQQDTGHLRLPTTSAVPYERSNYNPPPPGSTAAAAGPPARPTRPNYASADQATEQRPISGIHNPAASRGRAASQSQAGLPNSFVSSQTPVQGGNTRQSNFPADFTSGTSVWHAPSPVGPNGAIDEGADAQHGSVRHAQGPRTSGSRLLDVRPPADGNALYSGYSQQYNPSLGDLGPFGSTDQRPLKPENGFQELNQWSHQNQTQLNRVSTGRVNGRRRKADDGSAKKYVVCPVESCGRVLSARSNLKVHLRVHSGEMPHVCSYVGCDRRFKWRSSLLYHEGTHDKRANAATPGPTDT